MMAVLQPLVLMMAGGTGGHVYPALAVANELIERGYRVEWIGTARGLEHRVVPAAGLLLHCLPMRGIRGKSLVHKMLGLVYLALASLQALWLMMRLAPRCVVGMGGYASGPGGVAAWLMRRPLIIHEQNAVAGTTNRMLAPLATCVLAGFPDAFEGDVVSAVPGNPVRRALVERGQAADYDFAGQRPLRLLVLGGSLGAQPINQIIPELIGELSAEGDTALEVWHQTGEAHIETVRIGYGDFLTDAIRVVPFIEEMEEAYAWADLVLCRAGALTVAELAVMGRPSILVPLPHAIDDHQTANARFLAANGAAVLLPQADMRMELLADLFREFMAQPQKLAAMASASKQVATPDAAQRVADYCEEQLGAG